MPLFFLIGFPGSGKSYWGERLSSVYPYKWIDLDKEIERYHKSSISAIFSAYGEDDFRKKEGSALRYINDEEGKNIIVTTGGGTPCFYDNMEYMLKKGTVIWMQCSEDSLLRRLYGNKKRPLAQSLDMEGLKAYIKNKLKERTPFYSKAHYTLPETTTLQDLHHIITEKSR